MSKRPGPPQGPGQHQCRLSAPWAPQLGLTSATNNLLAIGHTVPAVHDTSIDAATAVDAVGVAGSVVSFLSVEPVVVSPAPKPVVIPAQDVAYAVIPTQAYDRLTCIGSGNAVIVIGPCTGGLRTGKGQRQSSAGAQNQHQRSHRKQYRELTPHSLSLPIDSALDILTTRTYAQNRLRLFPPPLRLTALPT
jgi:hypothetical protein